jgi:hypothetical protein
MILSFGAFIKQPVGSAMHILITRGRSRMYLKLIVAQSAAMIAFMSIGAHWAAKGVAIADVALTYSIMMPNLYYCFRGSPVTFATFFAAIARPAMASVAMAIALVLLRLTLPPLSVLVSLAIGAIVAGAVVLGVWMVLPGGRTELMTLFSDLRSALQPSTTRAKAADAAPVAN